MTMRVLAAAFVLSSLAALSGCTQGDSTTNNTPDDSRTLTSGLRVDRIQAGQGPRRLALPVAATPEENAKLLAANPALSAWLAAEGKGWTVSFDRRSGQPTLMQGPGIPWMPGTASGLTEQGVLGASAATLSPEDKAARLTARGESMGRSTLDAHPGMLGVDAASLALEPDWSGSWDGDGSQFLVTFRAAPAGFEQRDGRITFVVRDGNLVQIHAERVMRTAAMSPALGPDDAVARLHAAAGAPADARILSTQLQQLLLSTTREPAGVYTGALGKGYEAQLAYVIRFAVPGDTRTLVAYVDARSGALLDLFDDNRYGAVSGGVWPRNSAAGSESIVPFLDTSISNGSTVTTDLGGNYGYAGGTASTALAGTNFRISDSCGAPAASTTTAPGNLSLGTSTATDCNFSTAGHSTRAARNAFYHLNNVRLMGKKWLDGVNSKATTWFGANVTTNVNITQTCNAYWDGSTVNFFRSGGGCTNTGEIADVMQHEWGHGLDQNTKAGSVGDSAKGEAVADTVAILMTHDRCIGPGFFASGTGGETTTCPSAVRDLGKVVTQSNISGTCPTSTSCAGALGYECHCESHLLSGSTWDLANALVGRYGTEEGWQIFERLYLRALPNITAYLPGTSGNGYSAFLAADDDNGNVNDGTPNADLIYQAFNAHSIAGTQVPRNAVACPTRPAAPTLTATGQTGSVALSWTAVSGATSYQVLRAPVNGGVAGFLPVGSAVTGTSFTDTQVLGGYPYAYEVVATVGSCTSPLVAAVPATPTGGGGGDITPPTTSITAPAAGSTVAGNVTVTAAASDNVGVTNVEFYAGSTLIGSSASAPYSITWSSNTVGNGTVTLTSRAYDAASNAGVSAGVNVTVNNPGAATYDPTLRAPKCASVGVKCDTGTSLVLGRGSVGPEPSQPNTINGSCADGTTGTFHSDESVDRVVVTSVDGSDFAPGKQARVDVTVWVYNSAADKLDLYSTANASSPAWTLIATLTPTANGAQTLSATYTLPSGSLQAVRAAFRYNSTTASPCTTGAYDDRDDVVFAVGSGGPPDTTPPTVSITAPAAGSTVSGSTTIAANAADDVGVAQVELFVDGTLLSTSTTAPYSAAWNTTSVANGTHSLTARAYDAAGNNTTSAAVSVTVNNTAPQEIVTNGGFEGGSSPWAISGTAQWATTYPHGGLGYASLAGSDSITGTVYQQISIPASATGAFTFWLNVTSSETTTVTQYDKLFVEVRDTAGTLLTTLATYSNLNKGTAAVYSQKSLSLAAYKGQTVRLQFRATTDVSLPTTFRVDDVSVQ